MFSARLKPGKNWLNNWQLVFLAEGSTQKTSGFVHKKQFLLFLIRPKAFVNEIKEEIKRERERKLPELLVLLHP